MESKSEPNEWSSGVWAHLTAARQRSPLVQCITNFVSMDLVANTLLSAGASPAMVHSVVEIPDFTPHIHALCVNIGTLTPDWLPSMKAAAEIASKLGKPWVLDPAAVSCSGFRLKSCLELVELKPTVIKGNGSEIIALSSASPGQTKGADSSHESTDAIEAAKSLALSSGAVVAVSGAVDIVTDGKQVIGVHNGTKMMQKITATGCSLAGLVAAFLAIDQSRPLEATVSAMSVFGIAGELGEAMAKGPGSLRMHLIDSLYGLDETTVLSRVNITRFG
ncbi:hypothetical protein EUTSA_v10002635mg [Eutrema salsugineum]|uniref:Hydroxyethylthiazole kinase n=1 Tax=Eutrema salsugineum TaxID=72664 RepID=V4L0S7_EUTSA|nr:hydroxyethylthiazole kinase [Eutrema salsugineum]ESQ37229.1 hypothetical protein EUTSA_v10002635mg [Eutrema salsugineum]